MLFKRRCRIVALAMLFLAVGFFAYAITHPTASFSWNNAITYFIYVVYFLVMVVLFVVSFSKRR